MLVIPSINESVFSEIAAKIKKAEAFLPSDGWIHLDVSDGVFTPYTSWRTPEDMAGFSTRLNIEAHLMAQEPEAALGSWIAALRSVTGGARRIIVHVEAMTDPAYILESCAQANMQAGLALKPLTPPDLTLVYLRDFQFVQILAVEPGPSGQQFNETVLSKIRFFKERAPGVIIEVDGGMNPETALRVKSAGADAVVSGAYIWEAPLPKLAYEELTKI
ncbi:MAG: hypothetical protein HYT82_02010 [Candidatus Harrisonbacteria bacterium]|nr:hypothetical protein [Candidatus Harrisonbacteria bacterium]